MTLNTHAGKTNLCLLNSGASIPSTPMDKDGRYVNLNHPYHPSLLKLLKWKFQRNPFKTEKALLQPVIPIHHQLDWMKGDEDILIWLGHSSFYIRISGIQILIDPVFGDILTVRRRAEFPFDPDIFMNIDYILLSHDHRDHLDKKSLKLLATNNPQATYLAGAGSQKLLRKITGSDLIHTSFWYSEFPLDNNDLTITFVPAQHWSKRSAFDTNKRLWGGFVLESPNLRLFFGGDSGYDSHYRDIGKLFGGFNYVILGIGAYEPRWFMKEVHESPEEAIQAFRDLYGENMIPMHYGTFDLADEPLNRPLKELKKVATARDMLHELLIPDIGFPVFL